MSAGSQMAYVALGANIGDAAGTLRRAAAEIAARSLSQVVGSSLWRTEPVDCQPGSPPFLNAALGLWPTSGTTPESLLDDLLEIETQLGRTRPGLANAPRVIDLDLIVFGDEIRNTASLTLPHPRAHDRAFVLAPLVEIAPDMVLPGQRRTVAALLETLGQADGVSKLEPLIYENER
ncbi:MAG: 2-amino-4-hydroxy-6-hydroxymethyldihydropteridine diphosphokinase [Verrucomicrobiota bacterium]|nr:2-amino-4-hydroxy-6-hydroxymethyldihydropteridine diphosphokinase [Verrucomicrobiota bacterium]